MVAKIFITSLGNQVYCVWASETCAKARSSPLPRHSLRNPDFVLQPAPPWCLGDGPGPLRSAPNSESYDSTLVWVMEVAGNPKVMGKEEGDAEKRDTVGWPLDS